MLDQHKSHRQSEINNAMERGLNFLEKCQEADGSFVSFSSVRPRPFRRIRSWQTIFVPALMLASLSDINGEQALRIRQDLADFLLTQINDRGSFNYWSKSAPEYHTAPYPDDLDDTFCALAALRLHSPALVDETVLAQAVKLLLATETAVGGPYRTWLTSPDSDKVWLDVDLAVNSNVAYFLSLTGTRLPKLDAFMGQTIKHNAFSSPYYPFEHAFVYYLARAYQGSQRAALLRKTKVLHRQARTDLDQALCLTARLRLGDQTDLHASLKKLLQGQKRDGSWPAAAFYADPVKNGQINYNGAPALTTAFALEALQLYESQKRKSRAGSQPVSRLPGQFRNEVLALAKQQCESVPGNLRHSVLRSLRVVANGSNGKEIIDLTPQFYDSLGGNDTATDVLPVLSLANLYGWLAYSIFDDFLDGEGRAVLLPVATVALRRSLDCFRQVVPEETYRELIQPTFDLIDNANAWELAHCRWPRQTEILTLDSYPDYGDLSKLAERSFGHALTPLALLSLQGLKPSDKDFTKLRAAFAHYLIARQLNDDCHDWQEDLEHGHATYVVVRLLQSIKVQPGQHELSPLLSRARRHFWHKTLSDVCDEMRRQTTLSRQSLAEVSSLQTDNILCHLLDDIERSIDNTLARQSQAGNFLRHYKKSVAQP